MKFWKSCFLFILLPAFLFGQASSQDITKEKNSYAFGQIYTAFRYGFKDTYKPQAAFEFNQGIIGYFNQISEKVSGKIMLDVTRTTNFSGETDSLGKVIITDYFEGSKYTAYLKQAEIKWDINEYFAFRIGELLSTQYLTFQDKFWGYRYIDVTYQEKFRLGNPADFGVQLDFKYKDKLLNQFSVVNGEGPFRYQDPNSRFIYSNNIQYYPTERITLKLYVDYGLSPDTGSGKSAKSVITGFAGYKTEKFRVGAEYTYIYNYGFNNNTDYYGFSVYGSVVLSKYFQALGRYDHLTLNIPEEKTKLDYYIIGFQYEPVTAFTTSLNFRYYSFNALPFIYASFGLKF